MVKIVWKNGNTYVGQWSADKPNGRGKLTTRAGDVYEGQFKDGKIDGQGVARYADGRLYEGTFRKGLKDGKARFTDRCHSVFTGVYAADTIQSGRLDYYDGTIYFEGDFVNDQPYDGLWYYVKGNKPFIRLTQGKENKADE